MNVNEIRKEGSNRMPFNISRNRWVYESEGSLSSEEPVLPNRKELMMLGYQRFPKAMPLTDHSHDRAFEFVYCERGSVTWEVDDVLYETRAGQMFHTRPDERHRARMNYMEPCGIWWMIVQDPQKEAGWLELPDDDCLHITDALRNLPRVVNADKRIRELFQEMRGTLENANTLSSLKIKLCILDIILSLTAPHLPSSIPEDLLAGLNRVRDSMIHAPERRRINAEWALELGVSESHFYRLFKETFGQSPASFAEQHNMKKAEHLLRHSKQAITDIALELGFKTSQHFATTFKKNTGLTPSDWRKHHRLFAR